MAAGIPGLPPFRAYEHLVRLAALFAAGLVVFAAARWMLVPSDYGELGPYRAAAVELNQARPIVHAGQAACVTCHTDVAERRQANAHATISCETCHLPHAPKP